jgi:hypothetical protein
MFKTALFPTNHSNGGNVEQTFSDNSAEFSKIFWYFPVLDNIKRYLMKFNKVS